MSEEQFRIDTQARPVAKDSRVKQSLRLQGEGCKMGSKVGE